jgi:hypothetical protein
MKDSNDRLHRLQTGLVQMLVDNSSLHFSDFLEISQAMTEGYARLMRNGLPAHTVALAMLGATLNLYDMFGLRSELPDLLRSLADKLEGEESLN